MSYGPTDKEVYQLLAGFSLGLISLGVLLATVVPLIWHSVKPILLELLQ